MLHWCATGHSGKWGDKTTATPYLQSGRKCTATAHQHPGKIKTGYSHQPSKQARDCCGWKQDETKERDLKGRVSKVEEKQDLVLQLTEWSTFPGYLLFLDQADLQELDWGLEVMLCHKFHGRPSRASSNTAPESAACSSKGCHRVHCVHFLLHSLSEQEKPQKTGLGTSWPAGQVFTETRWLKQQSKEDKTNKIYKRAKRSHHTHLPSLEVISLTKTKQPAQSWDSAAFGKLPSPWDMTAETHWRTFSLWAGEPTTCTACFHLLLCFHTFSNPSYPNWLNQMYPPDFQIT